MNDETIIMDWYMLDDIVNLIVEFDVMSVSICYSKFMYSWVMLLIALYDGVMLVQITGSGAMNNVLSDGNHTNDNNTSTPSSSLSADAVRFGWSLRLLH